MPQQTFEVGDQVYLPQSKHFGTIVRVTVQQRLLQPDAPGVRAYAIKLDDGATITQVYRGIEPAPGKA